MTRCGTWPMAVWLGAWCVVGGSAWGAVGAPPGQLRVVGVLGNSAGLTDQPIPYAYYRGVAVPPSGLVTMAGAKGGIVVAHQDGRLARWLPLPKGMTADARLATTARHVYLIASDGRHGRLMRIDHTVATDKLAVEPVDLGKIALGSASELSTSLDPNGRVILAAMPARPGKAKVVAYNPDQRQVRVLFERPMKAIGWHHRHVVAFPDGTIGVNMRGRDTWTGRFDATGKPADGPVDVLVLDRHLYKLSYHGTIYRRDLDGKPAPGKCGSVNDELRMPSQITRWKDRHFTVGRGGVLMAVFDGKTFVYKRRIGALWVTDLAFDGTDLVGLAYTRWGNNDVQRFVRLPVDHATAALLDVGRPYYHGQAVACCPVYAGWVTAVAKRDGAVELQRDGAQHLAFKAGLTGVKQVGQVAAIGPDLLVVASARGVLLRRDAKDKKPVAPTPVPVTGQVLARLVAVAVDERGWVYVANARRVQAWRPGKAKGDARQVAWTTPATYSGVRRLAAGGGRVFVCDTKAHVVDQLDAATGRLVARLGKRGEPGSDRTHLRQPMAVALDPNAVYVADAGNGRVLVATTTLWRPRIARLPMPETGPPVAVRFPVDVPKAGRLSLNVYDDRDRTVRQLVAARSTGAGRAQVIWDGRDDRGRWCTPGTYRWHAGLAPKLKLRYVTSVGQSGTPPYRTADGTGSWGGVWGDVMDVCVVDRAKPASDIVVLWAFEEGEGGLIRMTRDGRVRWKQHLRWDMKASQTAVACDGQHVFVACASAKDAPAGQKKYGGSHRRTLLWRVDAKTGAYRNFPKVKWRPFGKFHTGPGADEVATDVAVHAGRVYITNRTAGEIYVADGSTGDLQATWRLDRASGIAAIGSGRFVCGSGTRIVELDHTGRTVRTVADVQGEVWDVDAAPGGDVIASVQQPRHQVVVLDASGREVRALGPRGGRPLSGPMQPASLLKPVGLCAMADGTMFVAENSTPRRFTRWSTDGRLERQFHGPYYFSGMFGVDESQPEFIYGDSHRDLVRYRVDYDTGRWSVDAYWTDMYAQVHVPAKWRHRPLHRNGKTYIGSGQAGLFIVERDRARGVAAVYGGPHVLENGKLVRKRGAMTMATWADLNGDGQQQPGEFLVTKSNYPVDKYYGPQQGWACYFDDAFNCYMHCWGPEPSGGVWMIRVVKWVGDAPVYRWDRAKQVGNPYPGIPHGGSGARSCYADDGAVYAFNGGYNAAKLPGVGHGHDWEFARITKYNPATGEPVWHVGRRCAGFAQPGDTYCPTSAGGKIGPYLFWTEENSRVHVWHDQHGLYVDTLLEDIMRGPDPSPYTVWVELFSTNVFRHPKTGKVYLIAGSDAIHIYEVTGFADMPVFSGTVTVTADGIAKAKTHLTDTGPRRPTYTIRRVKGPVVIDGDVSEFAGAAQVELALRTDARGQVRAMYDDTNLYVAFVVHDSSPLANKGSDPGAAFKTGDTVEVCLSAKPPGKQARRGPLAGDVRVMFTRLEGRDLAVGFWPVSPKNRKPRHYRSPAGHMHMDRVEVLKSVRVATHVGAGRYRLEGAVPLELLGLTGKLAGRRVGLDLAINFSDPTGTVNVAKLFWARAGAGILTSGKE